MARVIQKCWFCTSETGSVSMNDEETDCTDEETDFMMKTHD